MESCNILLWQVRLSENDSSSKIWYIAVFQIVKHSFSSFSLQCLYIQQKKKKLGDLLRTDHTELQYKWCHKKVEWYIYICTPLLKFSGDKAKIQWPKSAVYHLLRKAPCRLCVASSFCLVLRKERFFFFFLVTISLFVDCILNCSARNGCDIRSHHTSFRTFFVCVQVFHWSYSITVQNTLQPTTPSLCSITVLHPS